MIKVLQVFGEPLSNGGQESFVMNIYRNIDREKVQFDFYTPFFCDNEFLKNEIESYGGSVFISNGKFDEEANKKDFINKLSSFLKKNSYEIVHIHSGSIFNLCQGAKLAKKYGAKKVLVHSHATGVDNFKYRIIKFLSQPLFIKYADQYLACSYDAAVWKFPKEIVKNNRYKIIKNGIDLYKFAFNEDVRNTYREQLGIKDDELIIGNVGRLDYNKNHEFLLHVFLEFLKYNEKTKLLIIGNGTLKEKIIKLIDDFKIKDRVILLGSRTDVHNLMQAMDVFVFPSKFEGLGIVTIESQTAGLLTICSENVPDEANLTEMFKTVNLSSGPKVWAKMINELSNYDRKSYQEVIKKKGYDAVDVAALMLRIYGG